MSKITAADLLQGMSAATVDSLYGVEIVQFDGRTRRAEVDFAAAYLRGKAAYENGIEAGKEIQDITRRLSEAVFELSGGALTVEWLSDGRVCLVAGSRRAVWFWARLSPHTHYPVRLGMDPEDLEKWSDDRDNKTALEQGIATYIERATCGARLQGFLNSLET